MTHPNFALTLMSKGVRVSSDSSSLNICGAVDHCFTSTIILDLDLGWRWIFRLPVLLLLVGGLGYFVVVRDRPQELGFALAMRIQRYIELAEEPPFGVVAGPSVATDHEWDLTHLGHCGPLQAPVVSGALEGMFSPTMSICLHHGSLTPAGRGSPGGTRWR